MPDDVVQLGARDFDEAMDLLDRTFAEHKPHDFRRMHPVIYQPTDAHMRCNLALRSAGRIVAIVGVFPITLHVGGTPLRVAGIGGVGVHPDHRGRGHMRRLMDAAMAQIAHEGYELSYLTGKRQRYLRWGYEVCGTELLCRVGPDNVRHVDHAGQRHSDGPPDADTLAALRVMHDRQLVHGDRGGERFERSLRVWHRTPATAHQAGVAAAYACILPTDDLAVDLCARSDDDAIRFLAQLVALRERSLAVPLPALATPLAQKLAALSETCVVQSSGNWRVDDWVTVAGALLRLRHAVQPLPSGSVTLRATGAGVTFRLSVDGDATCSVCDEAPDLALDDATLMRVLFGPLPSACVADVPAILSSWCPLPLWMPVQDRV